MILRAGARQTKTKSQANVQTMWSSVDFIPFHFIHFIRDNAIKNLSANTLFTWLHTTSIHVSIHFTSRHRKPMRKFNWIFSFVLNQNSINNFPTACCTVYIERDLTPTTLTNSIKVDKFRNHHDDDGDEQRKMQKKRMKLEINDNKEMYYTIRGKYSHDNLAFLTISSAHYSLQKGRTNRISIVRNSFYKVDFHLKL